MLRGLARDGMQEMARQVVGVRERGLRGQLRHEWQDLQPESRPNGWTARAGQSMDIVGIFLTITVAAVVGYVGLTVMSKTENAGSVDTSPTRENQSEFANASEDLTSGVGTSMGLSEVVFIVLILGAIIGVLVGLRRR